MTSAKRVESCQYDCSCSVGSSEAQEQDERSADEEEDHFRVDALGLALEEDGSAVRWEVSGSLIVMRQREGAHSLCWLLSGGK